MPGMQICMCRYVQFPKKVHCTCQAAVWILLSFVECELTLSPPFAGRLTISLMFEQPVDPRGCLHNRQISSEFVNQGHPKHIPITANILNGKFL